MAEFENLGGFLEHVSLVMDNAADSTGDMVNLMTLHSAKGLEFDTVFLPGWEEGLFPSQRSMEEGGLAGLEEERRLAYVGLTRARRRGYVSFAANRRIHGQWQSAIRSRFVDELPAEHIEFVAEPGLGARAAASGFGAGGWGSGSTCRRRGDPMDRTPPAAVDRKRPGAAPRRRNPPGRRVLGRRPRVPPEIRLRRDHRGRRQQARDPFRARRRQKSHGRLCRARLTATRVQQYCAPVRPVRSAAISDGEAATSDRTGLPRSSPSARPSPFCRRVGIGISTFEAARLYSRYGPSDRSTAQKEPLSPGFDPPGYPTKPLVSYQSNRQFPWMEPSSTGDTRHRGAPQNLGIYARADNFSLETG